MNLKSGIGRFGLSVRVVENVNRFRGGLVLKAHRLVSHSTLGWRVIKKKKYGGTLVKKKKKRAPEI